MEEGSRRGTPPFSASGLAELAAIYREHRDFVWRCLYHQGVDGSFVEDALQDVFLVVHRKLAIFDGRTSIRSWLYGISRRVASEYRRGTRRGTRHLQVIPHPEHESLRNNEFGRVAALQEMKLLLDNLDETKREVFILAELEGMTAPEIAEVLQINVNTIYARIRAARKSFDRAVARHQLRQHRELL